MNDPRLKLLRRRNLGEVVSDSFAFQMPNWRAFAMVAGPAVMLGILFQLVSYLLLPETAESDTFTNEDFNDFLPFFAAAAAFIPFIFVIYQLTTAAVVVLMKSYGEGTVLAAGEALDQAQDRAKDLLLAALRSGLILLLVTITIIGIPFALYLGIRWSLIAQGIMVDGVSHRDALRYSAHLVDGTWWYTFGQLIVAGLVLGVPGYLATTILSGIFPGVAGIILSGCLTFFTYPYPIIATTLIFFDRKARKAEEASMTPKPPTFEPGM